MNLSDMAVAWVTSILKMDRARWPEILTRLEAMRALPSSRPSSWRASSSRATSCGSARLFSALRAFTLTTLNAK